MPGSVLSRSDMIFCGRHMAEVLVDELMSLLLGFDRKQMWSQPLSIVHKTESSFVFALRLNRNGVRD